MKIHHTRAHAPSLVVTKCADPPPLAPKPARQWAPRTAAGAPAPGDGLLLPSIAETKLERLDLARRGVARGSFRMNASETPFLRNDDGTSLVERLDAQQPAPAAEPAAKPAPHKPPAAAPPKPAPAPIDALPVLLYAGDARRTLRRRWKDSLSRARDDCTRGGLSTSPGLRTRLADYAHSDAPGGTLVHARARSLEAGALRPSKTESALGDVEQDAQKERDGEGGMMSLSSSGSLSRALLHVSSSASSLRRHVLKSLRRASLQPAAK